MVIIQLSINLTRKKLQLRVDQLAREDATEGEHTIARVYEEMILNYAKLIAMEGNLTFNQSNLKGD